MITLSTYQKQRDYLLGRGVTRPLGSGVLDQISQEISWSRVAKLENRIAEKREDLELLPNDPDITQLLEKFTVAISEELAGIETVFDHLDKTAQREKEDRQAHVVLMSKAKTLISTAANEILDLAKRHNSPDLTSLSQHVLALGK